MDKASLKHRCKLKPRPLDPNPSADKSRMLYTNQKIAYVILSFTWKKEKKPVKFESNHCLEALPYLKTLTSY